MIRLFDTICLYPSINETNTLKITSYTCIKTVSENIHSSFEKFCRPLELTDLTDVQTFKQGYLILQYADHTLGYHHNARL